LITGTSIKIAIIITIIKKVQKAADVGARFFLPLEARFAGGFFAGDFLVVFLVLVFRTAMY